jgi:DnaA-homolog protein
MIPIAPQIPFELFEPEPPTLDNFLVGENAEAVARLRALVGYSATGTALEARAITFWGAPAVGKTHLLSGVASAFAEKSLFLRIDTQPWPDDPFVDCDVLAVDNADRANGSQQGWLFTAFNHVTARGGTVLCTGATPPLSWQIRDDLRTRLGSGIVFEIKAIAQDLLMPLLYDYALQRGIKISEEVLTYVLSHTKRDVATLCHTINGIDRMSLALKRPITLPLVRAFLAQEMQQNAS